MLLVEPRRRFLLPHRSPKRNIYDHNTMSSSCSSPSSSAPPNSHTRKLPHTYTHKVFRSANEPNTTFLPSACYIAQVVTQANGSGTTNAMWINSVYERWWRRGKQSSRPDSQKLEPGPKLIPRPTPNPTLGRKPARASLPFAAYDHGIDVEKALVSRGEALLEWPLLISKDNVSTRRLAPDLTAAVGHKQDIFVCAPTTGSARRHVRIIRLVRYGVFTVYRRLFTLVFIVNIVAAGVLYKHHQQQQRQQGSSEDGGKSTGVAIDINSFSTLASANFLAAILVRQDWFVNVLFRSAWLVPWNVPLSVRKMAARVYCYGGIHSGAAVVGTLWWIVFTAVMSWQFIESDEYCYAALALTWLVLMLLLVILLFAIPWLRARYHDAFEATHRFLGWSSVAIFWIQLFLLFVQDASSTSPSSSSLVYIFVHNPTFWNLTIITILLIYPWLLLRRWTFTARPLSTHALYLSFPKAVHKFSCLAISSSPLREWHPFATFPSADPLDPGASMVISDAGDWTRNLIRSAAAHTKATGDAHVKLKFYVKSHPSAGVLSLTCLFARVLILTTGSGIGPCLSSLLENIRSSKSSRPRQFARLVWSSRSPSTTYGSHIMALVAKADPDALIIDTADMGRPDLLEVASSMYKQLEFEAVFVLSNQKVVEWVVGGLERKGVPAFGPIWDS